MLASAKMFSMSKSVCRAIAVLGSSLLFLISTCGVSAEELTNVFLKGPYLQGPGADKITIKWESPNNNPSLVRYGLKEKLDAQFIAQNPRPLEIEVSSSVTNIVNGETNISRTVVSNTVYLYEIALTNLKPNPVYTYQVKSSGVQTPPKHFRTFASDQRKVTFIAYGDVRTNPKIHSAVVANFKRYNPDFILHTGDLVANGTRYELWSREFFGPTANVLDEIPLLPSIGNHEADGNKYVFYMSLPGQQRWYSYDLGPVHVLALDFHYEKETDAQFAFAKQDLMTSKAPWKIVYLHYPVFNVRGHATGWGHGAFLPLFHRAKVDLVVTGHSHIYERFYPVAGENGPETWPITHITTGGGGAPLAPAYPHPALAVYGSTNHFVLFEATETKMKARAINTNNVIIDSFEWEKRNGRPVGRYFSHIYPERALKFFFEGAPSLTGSLASVPGPDSSAQIMFAIRPLEKPLQMKIELMPESAAYYKLENGPLLVTTPTEAESNKVVWAKVRTIAKRESGIDGRSSDLVSPPLRFQGRTVVGSVEALAYGQRCRVTDAAVEAAKARTDANN